MLMCLSTPLALAGYGATLVARTMYNVFMMLMTIAASIRGFADVEKLLRVGGRLRRVAPSFSCFSRGSTVVGDLAYYDANDFAMLCMLLPLWILLSPTT